MKKLDIMNNKDPVAPGEVCKWQLIGGKVTKVEEFIPTAIVVEKEEKEVIETMIEKAYPVVLKRKVGAEEEKPKKRVKIFKKKKRGEIDGKF